MSSVDYTTLPEDYFDKDIATLTADAIKEAREGWWKESMETVDERLSWWRDARLGCFAQIAEIMPFTAIVTFDRTALLSLRSDPMLSPWLQGFPVLRWRHPEGGPEGAVKLPAAG